MEAKRNLTDEFGLLRGCVLTVLREALDEAGVSPADIDAVAFTKGPGMG